MILILISLHLRFGLFVMIILSEKKILYLTHCHGSLIYFTEPIEIKNNKLAWYEGTCCLLIVNSYLVGKPLNLPYFRHNTNTQNIGHWYIMYLCVSNTLFCFTFDLTLACRPSGIYLHVSLASSDDRFLGRSTFFNIRSIIAI